MGKLRNGGNLRLNTISPGIVMTPLASDELAGPRTADTLIIPARLSPCAGAAPQKERQPPK